jgi:hypothetical protein
VHLFTIIARGSAVLLVNSQLFSSRTVQTMGRMSPTRHDELQHKLFVGGISHKFRDADLKQGVHAALFQCCFASG